MNTENSFSIERLIVRDPLFLKNPAMGWFFLYCHSQAMFKAHLTDIESLGERVLLQAGQFWKSARQLTRECPVASKSTLYRWGTKLEKEGYLTMRPFGVEKWDGSREKMGRGCLNHGTGILVITVLKYWINPVDLKKPGTGAYARQARKSGTAPPRNVGQEEKDLKKNKKGEQLIFSDEGTGDPIDLGRPQLTLVAPNPRPNPAPDAISGPINDSLTAPYSLTTKEHDGRVYEYVELG